MTEPKRPSAAPSINENPSASQWAADRGEKWRQQLGGMEASLAPVDEPLIRALRLEAPCRIADIGCGGGGTTLKILRQAPAGSVVHGFDISPSLIEIAQSRIPVDAPALAFHVADLATTLPPDAPYDRLSARFSVMFFDDPPLAFANIIRWLVPGGRFAFAVWAPPADNAWFTNVREVVAEVIELPPLAPDAPGPFRYGAADKLLTLLEQAGFGELALGAFRCALPVGGGLPAAEAASFALASFSSFGELLAQAGDQALHTARQRLTARLSSYEQGGTVSLDAAVHIITGTRPA